MPPTPNTPPTAQGPAQQTTMREFFAVLFRRRWLIIGLFFVVSATVMAIALSTPTMYASSGRVLVTRGERESALSGRVQILNDWEQDLASEVAKVRSETVLDRARALLRNRAERTGAKTPGIEAKRVDVEVMGKSNVIAIGYDDLNPQTAQEVCDALITSYVEFRRQRPLGETDSLFAVQIDSLQEQIAAKSLLRERTAQQTGVNDALEMTRAWSSQLSQLEQRQNDVAADLAAARSEMNTMREVQKHPEMDLSTLGGDSPSNENALSVLKSKVTDQQLRVATLRERYRDDSPEVVNALGTLETLQALLRKEVTQRLSLAQARVEQLQARLAVHDHDLAELRGRIGSLPRNQELLNALDAEIKTLRSRKDEFTKARDQARITANTSENVQITLLNPAGPPETKNARDVVRMLLAPAFSLVVGIGLAFFMDGLDITVRTASQAEQYLDLPVLATLPERRRRRR